MTPGFLRELFIRTRRSGNTEAVVSAAKTLGATVIAHTEAYAATLRKEGVRVLSAHPGAERVIGTTGPYLVDLPVLAAAADEWEQDRDRAQRAEEENARLRADLIRVTRERDYHMGRFTALLAMLRDAVPGMEWMKIDADGKTTASTDGFWSRLADAVASADRAGAIAVALSELEYAHKRLLDTGPVSPAVEEHMSAARRVLHSAATA